METAKYIYIQLSNDIHEDRDRILTTSDNVNKTIYLSDLSEEEKTILQSLIDKINTRLNS